MFKILIYNKSVNKFNTMEVGKFNIHDYLNKLYEESEKVKGGPSGDPGEGLIIPPENRKAYDWLKKEYQKKKQEVKVEMSSYDFKPGYSTEGLKDFKPGMYGTVPTSETSGDKDNKKQETYAKDQNIKISINKT